VGGPGGENPRPLKVRASPAGNRARVWRTPSPNHTGSDGATLGNDCGELGIGSLKVLVRTTGVAHRAIFANRERELGLDRRETG
jgi:hypothetical protein